MKTITTAFTLISTIATLQSVPADASMSCKTYDGKSLVVATSYDLVNCLGHNTDITISGDLGSLQLAGNSTASKGGLMSKTVIQLFNVSQPRGTLTLVEKPMSCGRGACDSNAGVTITGSLDLDGIQTPLTCHETVP